MSEGRGNAQRVLTNHARRLMASVSVVCIELSSCVNASAPVCNVAALWHWAVSIYHWRKMAAEA